MARAIPMVNLGPPPGTITDKQQVGGAATGGNPYTLAGTDYERYRPTYLPEAVTAALSGLQNPQVLDVGAGSGKFTRALVARGITVSALEPAVAMQKMFRESLPQIPLYKGKAEDVADLFAPETFDALCFAQCWHWVDKEAGCGAAANVLKPGGRIVIIYNQMNVSFPWVKRLSRVMRSGDVHHPDRVPQVGKQFAPPQLKLFQWGISLPVAALFALAKTRSSYLKASERGKQHMQANLQSYLWGDLALNPKQTVTLPYYTLVWIASKIS
ncbi:class I SAM-dependent methyltransferase [Varibaculum vaginae]|uniref:class I SAM-dependent methyltransferase n=1 Tax=Varibaculum vaginae TaxID=2364797 RepID=UPI0013586848|nr:class I SAM-dependent methyltransferase [Varibaculum vaginae]